MARAYRPAHARSRPSRSNPQRAIIGLGAVLSVLCLVGAFAVLSVNRKFDLIPTLSADTRLDEAVDGEPKNYLVVGSDSREDLDAEADDAGAYFGGGETPEGKRADVIMIVRVDPNGERLDILSLPRDLWIPIAGTDGSQRINTAYSAGPQQLIDTIRNDFDIEIHHYAEVDFQGFKGIVDTVGGVPMYFDRAMRDTNSGLNITEPGCVTLDGTAALAFARSRHLQYMDDGVWQDDPTGDLGRISRQQVFMRRMFNQVASTVSLTDLGDLSSLADVAIDYVTIDRYLEITKAVNVAKQFGTFEGESIQTHTLPVEHAINIFRNRPAGDIDPSLISVQVSNGSGTPMQATNTADALDAVGFTTEILADAPDTWDRTTVRYAPGADVGAAMVARHLATGAELREDTGLDAGTIVLTTGTDFTNVVVNALAPDDPAVAPATTTSTSVEAAPDDDASPSTTAPPSTTTTIGVTPGQAPEGVVCE